MAGFHKVNLKKDVNDSAKDFGLAPNVEARFATKDVGLEKSAFSYQRYEPNFRLPFGHKHDEQEELYIVTAGSGRMKFDDEIIEVEQWDAIRVEPQVERGWESGPDGLELLAIGAPNNGPPTADGTPMPGWWSD
jgi:mannose-6-phosphate isomerase-like protein (cupin superfamily)